MQTENQPDSGPIGPESSSTAGPRGIFATTHWSVVLTAQDDNSARSAQALEKLCQGYWYPLYAYARRRGHSAADAEDLTQEFFARLLEKGYLKAAGPEKGKFRTFLLTAMKRFLANEWDRRHAQKRGGFATVVPLDQSWAESRLGAEPAAELAPDVLFDRRWAQTLLERVVATLRDEYISSGRAQLFEHLRPTLVGEEDALPYARLGARLKLSEAAIKMAVSRLRARYRELLRAEIAQTVSTSAEIEEELRHLFSAFGS